MRRRRRLDRDRGDEVTRLTDVLRRLVRNDLEQAGEDPDPRFTFANERTFLAWTRTGLALIAGGLAAAQALHFGVSNIDLLVAIPAIVLGGVIGVVSFLRWERNERAMRLGEPVGYSQLARIVALGISAIAAISLILVVVHAITK
jgi:putative membrane protein